MYFSLEVRLGIYLQINNVTICEKRKRKKPGAQITHNKSKAKMNTIFTNYSYILLSTFFLITTRIYERAKEPSLLAPTMQARTFDTRVIASHRNDMCLTSFKRFLILSNKGSRSDQRKIRQPIAVARQVL